MIRFNRYDLLTAILLCTIALYIEDVTRWLLTVMFGGG